jgi:CheY-like chemotaxis protein
VAKDKKSDEKKIKRINKMSEIAKMSPKEQKVLTENFIENVKSAKLTKKEIIDIYNEIPEEERDKILKSASSIPKEIINELKKEAEKINIPFEVLVAVIFSTQHEEIPTYNKLLLVEDTEALVRSVTKLLSYDLKDWQIITAKTLEEAKEILERNKDIKTIITDMSYPKKKGENETVDSGIELIRYVKENFPSIKIIAYSGLEDYLDKAKEVSADAVLLKSDIGKLSNLVLNLNK